MVSVKMGERSQYRVLIGGGSSYIVTQIFRLIFRMDVPP